MEYISNNKSSLNAKICLAWAFVFIVFFISLYVHFQNEETKKNDAEQELKANILQDEAYKTKVEQKLNNVLIATLEASYFVTYLYYESHWFSDDIYYQEDLAKVDYGFQVIKYPKFIMDSDMCTLTAEIARSKVKPINRETVSQKTSDDDFILKEVDVAQIINDKLLAIDSKFQEVHFKNAEENIIKIFTPIAKKHNCTLDLKITDWYHFWQLLGVWTKEAYKINLNEKEKKLLWNSLRDNEKFLEVMGITKRLFTIEIIDTAIDALKHKANSF